MMYTLIKTIREAGRIATDGFGKVHSVHEKAKNDLVTEIDVEMQKVIVNGIKKKYPEHSIIAEESEFEINNSDYTWYIDPLDGTNNYFYGVPIYGISIGLFYKASPKIGAIYFPHSRELFYAERGKGAFMNSERTFVSKRGISKAMVLTTSQISATGRKVTQSLDKVRQKTFDYRAFGCATYALMLLASGKADAYIMYKAKPWDVAAGFLILEEAGGKITDLDGRRWDVAGKEFIATNRKIHNDLLKIIKEK